MPRRLGPKRATKIRRLFNLSKEDDVRKYVIRRTIPGKEGFSAFFKFYKIFRQKTAHQGTQDPASGDPADVATQAPAHCAQEQASREAP